MVRASKHLVLVGGLLGLAAFFQPFLTGTAEDGEPFSISAVGLLGDTGKAGQKAAEAEDPLTLGMAHFEALPGMMWLPVVMPVFVAAFFLTLLGAWGVLRRRFGRLFGLGAFVLGGLVLGFALILLFSQGGDQDMKIGVGGHMLLATGLCGFVCGLVTLVKPDRRRRASATPD